ncbi:hypothetical protein [Helicobacter pylori]|uniref:hypothetical protein n=1 Tax=Helicobacter pylori TaxID=210 RepID=UPI003563D79D
MQKMYQNENLFTMRLILPQIYWISKKVLGCFNAFNQTFKSVFNLIGIWFKKDCCKINAPISRIMGINP